MKRGREKQMMKEKMIKTPDDLQKQNCSVLVGLLMDLVAVLKKKKKKKVAVIQTPGHPPTQRAKE